MASLGDMAGDAWQWFDSILRPGKYFNKASEQVAGLSDLYKQLAEQQWGRQMQGLSQAMPYLQENRQRVQSIYGQPGQAPKMAQDPYANVAQMVAPRR